MPPSSRWFAPSCSVGEPATSFSNRRWGIFAPRDSRPASHSGARPAAPSVAHRVAAATVNHEILVTRTSCATPSRTTQQVHCDQRAGQGECQSRQKIHYGQRLSCLILLCCAADTDHAIARHRKPLRQEAPTALGQNDARFGESLLGGYVKPRNPGTSASRLMCPGLGRRSQELR